MLLVGITAIWGLTFVMVRSAIATVPPFEFLALRFALASLILLPWAITRRTALRRALLPSLGVSAALTVGYIFQTLGLQEIGATQSGFITGMFVVFTPVLAVAFTKKRPAPMSIAAVLIATVGMYLLSGRSGVEFRYGSILTLACAVAFAAHIVALGHVTSKQDTYVLTFLQMAFAALTCTALWLGTEHTVTPASDVWFAIAVTGGLASALAFLVMTWAQKALSATSTALILTMEPVFAGLAGFVFLRETLGVIGWLGAGLILASMLMESLRPVGFAAEGR